MAKRTESKGARLLAILLALIMIGSILTYAAKRAKHPHSGKWNSIFLMALMR